MLSGRAGKLLPVAHPRLAEGRKLGWDSRALQERRMLPGATGFPKYSCIIPNSTQAVAVALWAQAKATSA